MLSIGWRFQKEAAEMTGLSLSIGVAVADCLKELTGVPVGLKWPNDLWYRDQKLGGILVDLNTSSRGATVAVVGIGINLHEPGSNRFDPGQPVTDLFSNAEDDLPPRTTIIAHVLGAIANVLDRFHPHQFAPDQDRFNALDVFAGRKVRAESKGKLREGIGKGADELGRYCVHCANGVVETINSGDISLSLAD
jgi:BirA family biotin operon repressor/biotin-[acetyl-CoA-carboxylase] ligase